MVEQVTTRYLRDAATGTLNGTGVTVRNDEWLWGGSARTNAGSLFVQSNYNRATMRTQIDYAPGSLLGTLTASTTTGPLTFSGAVGSNGLLNGSATAKIGSNEFAFSTQSGYGVTHNFPSGGSVTATLNPYADRFDVIFRDTSSRRWDFQFTTGWSSSSGFFFGSSIFSTSFL